jgi:hypothetical protein
MTELLTVRLGRELAADLENYLRHTGRKKSELAKEAIAEKIREGKTGLPAAASRWAGQVDGPAVSATNGNVRRSFKQKP